LVLDEDGDGDVDESLLDEEGEKEQLVSEMEVNSAQALKKRSGELDEQFSKRLQEQEERKKLRDQKLSVIRKRKNREKQLWAENRKIKLFNPFRDLLQ
jgi:hypothetical protein